MAKKQIIKDKILKILTEKSFDIISILDSEGNIVFESNAVKNILGYDFEERIGENVFRYVHPDDMDKVITEFKKRDKTIKKIEFRFLHKDGTWHWFESIGQDYINDPEINGVIINSRDITDRKSSEIALLETELKLRKIIEHIPDTLFHIDITGKILNYYQGKKQILEEVPDFSKFSVNDITQKEMVLKMQNAIRKTIEIGYHEEYFERKLDRNYIFLSKFIKLNEKQVLMLRSDLTKIIENERELEKLNADKDRFITILAHDLKNPLSAILFFLELLSKNIRKYDTDKIEKQLNILNNSAKNTFLLLENILMWVKAHTGKFPFKPEKLNFEKICNQIIENLLLTATTKNITIHYSFNEDRFVFADKNMLETILRNLISNAIKFTNKGGRIDISTNQNQKTLVICVLDNGIGIKPENSAKMFDILHPQTTEGTENETGTGFGLLICKEFVEKQGGKIWVESEEGKGSNFKFTIPLYTD